MPQTAPQAGLKPAPTETSALGGTPEGLPMAGDKPPRYIFLPALPLERVSLISVWDIIA